MASREVSTHADDMYILRLQTNLWSVICRMYVRLLELCIRLPCQLDCQCFWQFCLKNGTDTEETGSHTYSRNFTFYKHDDDVTVFTLQGF